MENNFSNNVLKFPAEKRRMEKEASGSKGFALFNEGLYFFNNEEYDRALSKFSDAENSGYKSSAMLADIAYIYREKDDDERALIYIKKALRLDKECGFAHSILGKIYSGKGMPEKALKHLCLAEEYDYIEMYSLALVSIIYEEPPFSNYMKAIEYANKVIENFPEESYAYMNKAMRYYGHQEFQKALKYLKKAETINTTEGYNSTDYYFQISYCYSMLNKPKKAIEYANRIIFSDKTDWKGYYRKGFAYFMDNADLQAIKAFLLAEKYGCKESDMYTRLAYSYIYSDEYDFDKAEFYAKKALKLNKNDADAYFVRGCAYLELKKDYKTALKYYRKYLKLFNGILSPDFYGSFCFALVQNSQYKQADYYAAEALELYPESVILNKIKINTLMHFHQYKHARKYLDKLTELYKDDPEIVFINALYYFNKTPHKKKAYLKCIELCSEIKDSGIPDVFAIMAISYWVIDEYEKSISCMEKFIMQPESGEVSRGKNFKEIEKYYNRLFRKFPKSPLIKKLEGKFGCLRNLKTEK